jgi:hypothetical protein
MNDIRDELNLAANLSKKARPPQFPNDRFRARRLARQTLPQAFAPGLALSWQQTGARRRQEADPARTGERSSVIPLNGVPVCTFGDDA